MTTLAVPVTTNFSAATFAGADIIDFTNLIATTATATFANTQFNNVAILNTALIDGSAGVNNIVINGGSVTVSQWSFANWTPGTDTIRINGSSGNDIISGSNQNDIIDGGQGADTLIGGGGDDIIDYSALELLAGESIQGGAGTGDTLRLNQAAGTYAFSTNATTLTGMERIEFNSTNTVSAEFIDSQVGQFTTVVGGAGADTFQVTGSANISLITFQSWGANDRIRLLGSQSGAELLTGSAQNDFFNGGAGNDTLLGELGNDTFNYTNAADLAGGGERINGGDGAGDRIELANAGSIQLNAATIIDVEILDYLSGTSTANLAGTQIGIGAIGVVDGSASVDALVVSGKSVDLSSVDFANWSVNDTITINGNASGPNILHGSTLKDTINGGDFEDDIFGEGGADILNGGASDDAFRFTNGAQVVAGLQIDGGAQTDKIALNSGTGFDFSLAAISNVERLDFFSGAQTATFAASQVGTGKINQFVAQVGGPATLNIINAASLNLSTAAFTGFGGSDSVNITGTAGADVITGSGIGDTITGGDGADTLSGGGGDDRFVLNDAFHFDAGETIDGGAGLGDTLVLNTGSNGNNYNAANLTNVERLEFGASGGRGFLADANFGLAAGRINAVTGSALTDRITIQGATINLTGVAFTSWTNGTDEILLAGTVGTDIIIGSSQDDSFNPNEGADTLIGGLGNDTFNFNSASLAAGDSVDGGGGIGDRITVEFSNSDFTNVLISGIEFIDINSAATLSGTQIGAGAITNVKSIGGVDRLNVNGAAVNLSAVTFTAWTNGVDVITINGTTGADALTGSSQNDVIDGGIDALVDTLTGLGGNDTYVINSATDNIIETTGGGTADRAKASVSFILAAGDNIEFLETTDAALTTAINLTGNEIAQTITGNAGANILNGGIDALADILAGGLGNDTYIINSALDNITELVGGGTADRAKASVSFALAAGDSIEFLETTNAAGVSAINLIGNEIAQTITGNAGINQLNGGIDALADVLIGGLGSDTYIINSVNDNITELVGGGTADRARASLSFTLAAGDNIEFLETTNAAGAGLINLTGNEIAQTITGNAGANILAGAGGNDTLTGGLGADTFLFNTTLNAVTNLDVITDFNVAADTIQLENTGIFTALGAALGVLDVNLFKNLTTGGAVDATDRILYNDTTGAIFYDADGSGATAAIQFATLTGSPTVTNADFFVV